MVTRRRLLIGAAAAGLTLPFGAAANPRAFRWRGVALGAEATILLHHPDRGAAERIVAACVAEIARLEAIFSLYRPGSALRRLNRAGALDAPPPELVALLSEAKTIAALTGGAFDPTVQPLWRLYAAHFAAADADPAGPAAEAIDRARALVDHRAVAVDSARISLRPGMAVTLNGIAQGYVTDRVAELLRGAGLAHVLIDLGEVRALDGRPDGTPWRVALGAADGPTIDLTDRAVTTSRPDGTRFGGHFHHLFDPATGRSADRATAVSVIAPRATTADALSTALAVLPVAAPGLLRATGADAAWLDGRRIDPA